MNRFATMGAIAALLAMGGLAVAQEEEPPPFQAGPPLGLIVDGEFHAMSDNVKAYGAIFQAEACTYDPVGGHIVAINRGVAQNQNPDDAFISLINHDGTVYAPRFIGFNRDGFTLNQTYGADVVDGVLYVVDSNGGERTIILGEDGPAFGPNADREAVVRMFDMATGTPMGEYVVPDSATFNDIAVDADGTVYASETSNPGRIFKITSDGEWSVFLEGGSLNRPNGVAIDNDGNIVIVNIGDTAVLTYTPNGELILTENAVQSFSDGIVITADGTKYVSSVRNGGVSMIPPGGEATLIAENIPSAASMCYDSDANQLVVPMTSRSTLGFIQLGM